MVLITGGARGIGLDAARRLVQRGARVALVDVDGEEAARRAEELGDSAGAGGGPRAAAFEADVTDVAELEAAVAGTVERFGGIDAVVAGAGIAGVASPVADIEPADFERVIEINLLGVWRTVRATLPHVLERQGYVLPIASIAAVLPVPLMSAYAAAKAGVEAFGRGLRVELAGTGARVGVAYFGFIDTDLTRGALSQPILAEAQRRVPAAAFRSLPVGAAGDAIVRGIERRASKVYAPRWVPLLLAARGLQSARAEQAMGRSRFLPDAGAAPPG